MSLQEGFLPRRASLSPGTPGAFIHHRRTHSAGQEQRLLRLVRAKKNEPLMGARGEGENVAGIGDFGVRFLALEPPTKTALLPVRLAHGRTRRKGMSSGVGTAIFQWTPDLMGSVVVHYLLVCVVE